MGAENSTVKNTLRPGVMELHKINWLLISGRPSVTASRGDHLNPSDCPGFSCVLAWERVGGWLQQAGLSMGSFLNPRTAHLPSDAALTESEPRWVDAIHLPIFRLLCSCSFCTTIGHSETLLTQKVGRALSNYKAAEERKYFLLGVRGDWWNSLSQSDTFQELES